MNTIPIIGKTRKAIVMPQSDQDSSNVTGDAFSVIFQMLNSLICGSLPANEGDTGDANAKEKTKAGADMPDNLPQADNNGYFSISALVCGMLNESKEVQSTDLPEAPLKEEGVRIISPDPDCTQSMQPQNEPVISILEGNIKDIGPDQTEPAEMQREKIPAEGLQPDKRRAVARMPQFTEYVNKTNKPEISKTPDMVNGDNLCPLENGNDPARANDPGGTSVAETVIKAFEPEGSPADDKAKAEENDLKTEQADRIFQVDIGPEKVNAAVKLEEASHTSTKHVGATAENLFDTMVEQIECMRTGESNRMVIQLKPEFLGKVTIELSLEDQGLHVKIQAEDSGVRSLIGGQIGQLAQSLAEKGIRVSDIDVAYGGIAKQTGEQPQERKDPQKQNGTRYRKAAAGISLKAPLFVPLDEFDAPALGLMLNSVEFRA